MAEWHESWSSPFPQDERGCVGEIDILDLEARQLGAAHPGIEQQANNGEVASGKEPVALAGSEQTPNLIVPEDRGRLFGDDWRPESLYWRRRDLILGDSPAPELLECPELHGHRRRLDPCQAVGYEPLKVGASNRSDLSRKVFGF